MKFCLAPIVLFSSLCCIDLDITDAKLSTNIRNGQRVLKKDQVIKKGKKGNACSGGTPDFSDMFVFGDSFSDTGNLASISAYPARSATNGKFAVEYLADELGLELSTSFHLLAGAMGDPSLLTGNNYAVAGAGADPSSAINGPLQVGAFLQAKQGMAPPDAFYLIMIGSNNVNRDVFEDKYLRPENKTDAEFIQGLKPSVKSIADNLVIPLLDAGAKHIMVVDSARMGKTPYAMINQPKERGEFTEMATDRFNRFLEEEINAIECDRNIDIGQFQRIEETLATAIRSGLQGETPCILGPFGITAGDPVIPPTFGGLYDKSCVLPGADGFLYWDELHPTTAMHKIFSDLILDQVCVEFGVSMLSKKDGKKGGKKCKGKKGAGKKGKKLRA